MKLLFIILLLFFLTGCSMSSYDSCKLDCAKLNNCSIIINGYATISTLDRCENNTIIYCFDKCSGVK